MVTNSPDDSSRHEEPPKAPDTLDEKLRAILESHGLNYSDYAALAPTTDEAIAQILQAVQEAGYQKVGKVDDKIETITVYRMFEPDWLFMRNTVFLDRFKAEMDNEDNFKIPPVVKELEAAGLKDKANEIRAEIFINCIDTAAKRAANLPEDSK